MWAVEVQEGPEVASRLAREYGFQYLGPVIYNYSLIRANTSFPSYQCISYFQVRNVKNFYKFATMDSTRRSVPSGDVANLLKSEPRVSH